MAPNDKPKLRTVELQVAEHVTDTEVNAVVGLGMTIISQCERGNAVLVFMSMDGELGKEIRKINMNKMIILGKGDIDRTAQVMNAIDHTNREIIKAKQSGNVADQLTAQVVGNKTKDNAERVAGAGQAGGIIVP